MAEQTREETLAFQAEVTKLLQIVANSLYSRKEVFLRELISNASDACDRLRYEAITNPALTADDPEFKVVLTPDAKARTLTIADNGIGMTRQELIDNLGTIARSGSAAFAEQLAQQRANGGDKKDEKEKTADDIALIGQFGVGFYSAFIVADKVEVTSRRAGSAEVWRWTSDGKGTFSIVEAARPGRGTTIVLHLREDQAEFTEEHRLRSIVKAHSDHIGLPVKLATKDAEETLNAASALWTRAKKDVTEEQYKEFYQHVAHAFDEPWMTIHARAEGRLEYVTLLFVPSARPPDLFHVERKATVRLYVRRVFVTDDAEGLLPSYLRFLRGVVDTEDIALNVSREMLQHDPILAKIGSAIVTRVLSELEKKAEKEPESYARFWDAFGAVLKEGIYEDVGKREQLLKLARFHATAGEALTSLAEYVKRMKDKQESIFYLTGDDAAALKASPHLEGFLARGYEVLLLSDPVDEFWIPSVGMFEGKRFLSVAQGAASLGPEPDKESKDQPDAGELAVLIALLKQGLGDLVKDVRASARLTDSPVCLVADERDMPRHLARMLRAQGQLKEALAGILEINPSHPLIRAMVGMAKDPARRSHIDDLGKLLLDQAHIREGDLPADAAGFAKRLSDVMTRAVSQKS
ncbi:MAG: molecular chaperone HtpG [Alphaproteobacteria bacterium]|nr:molecular chaperone HtpG [Alphaproteobacteria bacterium]